MYGPGAAGTPTPIRTLPVLQLTDGPLLQAIAIDQFDNLYLMQENPPIIRVYHQGANGPAVPFRIIGAGVLIPQDMDFDTLNNLYVGDSLSVQIFDGTARIRRIEGSHTEISNGFTLAADPNGVVYVGGYSYDPNTAVFSNGRVTAYAPGANGDATPLRTITGFDGIPMAMAINKKRVLRIPKSLPSDLVIGLERYIVEMAGAIVRFWPSLVPVPTYPLPTFLGDCLTKSGTC